MESIMGTFSNNQKSATQVTEAQKSKMIAEKNRMVLEERKLDRSGNPNPNQRNLVYGAILNEIKNETHMPVTDPKKISALDLKKYFDEHALGVGTACKVCTIMCYEDDLYVRALKAVANMVKNSNYDLNYKGMIGPSTEGKPQLNSMLDLNLKKAETTKTHHSIRITIGANEAGQRYIWYNWCTRVPNAMYWK